MSTITRRVQKTVAELKRRKVFQVGTVYLVTAWGLSMGVSELFPTFGAPDWAARYVIAALLLGFPIALILAWAFEVRVETPLRELAADSATESTASATTTISQKGSHLNVIWFNSAGQHSKKFNNNLTIGRDPKCDICIDDGSVSRRHAQISYISGQWWIEDLGSSNGTLLNGALIGKSVLPGRSEITLSVDVPALKIEIDDLSLAETRRQNILE